MLKAVPAVALVLPQLVTNAHAQQLWRPDFCFGSSCRIEIGTDFSFISFLAKCSAHSGIQATHTLTDSQLFDAVLQSSRRKEVVRWGAKLFRNIEEDVPFTVDADGTIHIATGLAESQRGQFNAQVQMIFANTPVPRGTVSVVVD